MLNLEPETEASLATLARRNGISVEAYLRELVNQELSVDAPAENNEDKVRAFLLWADSFPQDGPLLSDEAISREALYPDR